jgi:hypothetical protein
MGIGEILSPEFGVLLVGKVKSDLANLALNHHFKNFPVLRGSAVCIRSVSKKITPQAFQWRRDIRTM